MSEHFLVITLHTQIIDLDVPLREGNKSQRFNYFTLDEISSQNMRFREFTRTASFTNIDLETVKIIGTEMEKNGQLIVVLYKYKSRLTKVLSLQDGNPFFLGAIGNFLQALNLYLKQRQPLVCQAIVTVPVKGRDCKWIQHLEEVIADHICHESLSVETLATLACLSTRQLSRRIRSALGVSPRKFLREVQLQLAKRALESGEVESVFQVALGQGFEYASTFSKLFKQRFGKCPSKYLC
ncbi:helix-turn-helix domain-containing protein [Microscilla marina]|uniref:Two-component system sensor histidine kinase/response regulator, hybrid, putative n=1 Tax=Microscilla marina ATCC 23134 TaxID=313606 RepID=A1ZMC5_MICM2|nr:helix-turn-helix domain-containing protein [Microscilla marina]EAY28305.1 two-component system sensor histidine kinase/response regulator, hybrid, putative [Microscilla marina ATCC 23134]